MLPVTFRLGSRGPSTVVVSTGGGSTAPRVLDSIDNASSVANCCTSARARMRARSRSTATSTLTVGVSVWRLATVTSTRRAGTPDGQDEPRAAGVAAASPEAVRSAHVGVTPSASPVLVPTLRSESQIQIASAKRAVTSQIRRCSVARWSPAARSARPRRRRSRRGCCRLVCARARRNATVTQRPHTLEEPPKKGQEGRLSLKYCSDLKGPRWLWLAAAALTIASRCSTDSAAYPRGSRGHSR